LASLVGQFRIASKDACQIESLRIASAEQRARSQTDGEYRMGDDCYPSGQTKIMQTPGNGTRNPS
jgi:hypothetical protein